MDGMDAHTWDHKSPSDEFDLSTRGNTGGVIFCNRHLNTLNLNAKLREGKFPRRSRRYPKHSSL